MKERKFIKSTDVLVIIIMVFLSGLLLIFMRGDSEGLMLNVTVGRNLVYSRPLSEVAEGYIYSPLRLNNVRIYVEIDGVSVAYSDCQNQICVKNGKITSAGQIIICAPNELIVELKDNEKEISGLVTGW